MASKGRHRQGRKADAIVLRELGSVSAELDDNLAHYYVADWRPYEKAQSFGNRGFFLLGRTGSGKSAILQKLRLDHRHSDDLVIVDIKPDELFLSMHQHLPQVTQFADSAGHPEFAFKIIWNLVVAGECLRALRDRSRLGISGKWRIADNMAYQFMHDAGLLAASSLSLSDKVIRVLKSLKPTVSFRSSTVDVKAALANESQGVSIHALLRDCRIVIERVIPDMLGMRSMYILFDDLDLGWRNEESCNVLLRSLVQTLVTFSGIDTAIKPLAAIRTNIFDKIGLYQTEKISDYIVRCYWTKQDVRRVIERRMAYAYDLPEGEVWSRFFDERISIGRDRRRESFDALYERTLGRPRDFLQLLTECLRFAEQRGHRRVTKEDITDAVAVYSEERTRALTEEWRFNYPGLTEVLRLFARIEDKSDTLKIKYDYTELWDLLVEGFVSFEEQPEMLWFYSLINGTDLSPLVRELFRLGFLGIKSSPRQPTYWAHEPRSRSLASIRISGDETHFYVAPIFRCWLENQLGDVG